MKHDLKITLFLLMLFLVAQVVGLFLLNQSIVSIEKTDNGTIEVTYSENLVERPDLKGESSFTYTLSMILIGTVLLLLLIRFKLFKVWKIWFFIAVWGALSIALSVLLNEITAVVIAFILTYFKLFRPNIFIHNVTEIFMYGGIAILLSPIFSVFWAIMLLIAISAYDALAVWKLKHMITLAKAQAEEKMFAGLLIPYSKVEFHIKADIPKGFKEKGVKSAILGGGDIAFPMLFAGSVMTWLIQEGITQQFAYFLSLIIPLFAGISLFILLLKSKKDKFYPAMPFITVGCLIGYWIVLLLH